MFIKSNAEMHWLRMGEIHVHENENRLSSNFGLLINLFMFLGHKT